MADDQQMERDSSFSDMYISLHAWESSTASRRPSSVSKASNNSQRSYNGRRFSEPNMSTTGLKELEFLKPSTYKPNRQSAIIPIQTVAYRNSDECQGKLSVSPATRSSANADSKYSDPGQVPSPLRVPRGTMQADEPESDALLERSLEQPSHSFMSGQPEAKGPPLISNSYKNIGWDHNEIITLPPELPKRSSARLGRSVPRSSYAIRMVQPAERQLRDPKSDPSMVSTIPEEASSKPSLQTLNLDKALPTLPSILTTLPTSPSPSVDEGRKHCDKRCCNRRSRGLSHSSKPIARLNRASFTPSDLVRPPVAFRRESSYRREIVSRTLGQTSDTSARNQDVDEESLSNPPRSHDSSSAPPDGGFFAWSLVVCCFFGTFCTWGLALSFGIFAAWYKVVMLPSESLSNLSLIGSVQIFMLLILGQPIGSAIERGFFRPFSIGGSILLVSGIFATSWCTEWWQLLHAQGLSTGIGMGFVFSSGALCLMEYFQCNLGKAMALAASGSCVGTIVYTSMFAHLIEKVGFAWTTRVIGFLTVLLLIPFCILTRPRTSRHNVPSANSTKTWKERWRQTLQVFTNKPYLIMTLGFFFAFLGLYFAMFHIVLYSMQEARLSGTRAANILIAMSALNLLGRMITGLLSDSHTGPLNLVISSCIFSGFFYVIWAWCTTEGSLFVVACFYGFSSGGIQALFSPAMHSFSMDDQENMTTKGALFLTTVSVGALVGSPAAGALVGHPRDKVYLSAQLFAAGSMLAAAVLLAVARWLRVGCGPPRRA